jgi:hypothetical protein
MRYELVSAVFDDWMISVQFDWLKSSVMNVLRFDSKLILEKALHSIEHDSMSPYSSAWHWRDALLPFDNKSNVAGLGVDPFVGTIHKGQSKLVFFQCITFVSWKFTFPTSATIEFWIIKTWSTYQQIIGRKWTITAPDCGIPITNKDRVTE